MGRETIIDYSLLKKWLKDGKTPIECASKFGVTKEAIYQARKKLGLNNTKIVAIEAAGEVVVEALDSLSQIRKINNSANRILDLMMDWINGDKTAIQTLEHQIRMVNVGTRGEPDFIEEYKITDPHITALKAMGEIRNQLKLQLEIFQAVYDVKAAGEFQTEVIAIIGEVDPDARTRIVDRLRERQAIRQSVTFS